MMKLWGLVVFGVMAAGCGHEQTTGSASNGWATPIGYASVPQDQVRKQDPQLPPTMPRHAAAREAYNEERAPVDALQAKIGNAPPVERGSALPPDTVAPPPPSDVTPPPPSDVTPPPSDVLP